MYPIEYVSFRTADGYHFDNHPQGISKFMVYPALKCNIFKIRDTSVHKASRGIAHIIRIWCSQYKFPEKTVAMLNWYGPFDSRLIAGFIWILGSTPWKRVPFNSSWGAGCIWISEIRKLSTNHNSRNATLVGRLIINWWEPSADPLTGGPVLTGGPPVTPTQPLPAVNGCHPLRPQGLEFGSRKPPMLTCAVGFYQAYSRSILAVACWLIGILQLTCQLLAFLWILSLKCQLLWILTLMLYFFEYSL